MKKILLLALAVAITLFIGCGRRNAATAGTSSAAGSHQDHSACDHDHPGAEGHTTGTHRHEDEHSHGDQEGHDHSHGEACDHEGHSHDTQSHAGADTGGRGNNTAEYDPLAGHDLGEEEAADPDEIVFPSEQPARTDFKVEPAARTSFPEA